MGNDTRYDNTKDTQRDIKYMRLFLCMGLRK